MTQREVLDFVYLDVPRLESIASQLLEGIPETTTESRGREVDAEAEISGGVPFVLRGSAGTRAVFSASSAVTSRYHHRLVVEVIHRLEEFGFLYEPEEELPDGAFVKLVGELQIVDPHSLARFMRSAPDLQQFEQAFSTEGTPAPSNMADRRGGRSSAQSNAQKSSWPPRSKTQSIEKVLEIFAGDSARVRLAQGAETLAVGVVERDKFVEDPERLIVRHGQWFGGEWTMLGQTNAPGASVSPSPGSRNIFDLVERGGANLTALVGEMSGVGSAGVSLTPLAIYRAIAPKR